MSGSQLKGSGFFRSISPLPLLSGINSGSNAGSKQLSSKEKKYVSNIDKALTVFDSVEEWADYISYLSKLLRALQTNPDPETNHWVPNEFEISKTLSKCLSPKLPSGVHRKALEVYVQIFQILGPEETSLHVNTWLPGLLPLMSYASISVKPQLVELFKIYIVPIKSSILQVVFKAILLSLLPALDDTTSESFDSVLALIVSFKTHLNNDSHFWQCLFLCIVTSPDKRLGALEWCIRKMPSFKVTGDSDIKKEEILDSLDDETRACVTPEPGLLIKAFSEGLRDENLLVQRGFFDLLITKLPLKSQILQVLVTEKDKQLLVLNATGTVLRRDMSLNRRLWNWLLGPTTTEQAKTEQTVTSESRSQFFKKYGLKYLTDAVFALLEGRADSRSKSLQQIEACKIAVAIMDKWEIGQLIVPKILIPIIKCTRDANYTDNIGNYDELIKNANAFFDSVETINIWSDVLRLIREKDIDLVLFIIKNFRVEEEDMVVLHLPLALLGTLFEFDGDARWLELMRALLTLIPQRAFLPIEHANDKYVHVKNVVSDSFKEEVTKKLDSYYGLGLEEAQLDIAREKPFNTADLTAILLSLVTHVTTANLGKETAALFYNFCDLLDQLLQKIPNGEKQWSDQTLLNTVTNYRSSEFDDTYVPIAFGISLIFQTLARQTSGAQLLQILKTVIDLLWSCLVHPSGRYQLETVKMICKLELSADPHYIEAALVSLFLESDRPTRVKAFNALWTHSVIFNETEDILIRPLKLLLDDLSSENETHVLLVTRWLRTTVTSGSIKKVFKISCSGLISSNKFIGSGVFSRKEDEDFALFNYQLTTFLNLLKADEAFILLTKSETCTLDNEAEFSIVTKKHWDITTYKSLICEIVSSFLSIDASQLDRETFEQYCGCVRTCLTLLELLIDGTESKFPQILSLLTQLCKRTRQEDDSIVTFYLATISKFLKIASQAKIPVEMFALENDGMPPRFAQVVSDGILNSKTSLVLASWNSLIITATRFVPDLVFKCTFDITACFCEKLDEFFTINSRFNQDGTNDIDDSILELINGLQDLLNFSHRYLKSSNSGLFSNDTSTGRESSFFGSVIQGVFQVEAPDEKSESYKKRVDTLKALKLAVETCYWIWLWSDDNSKVKANTITVAPSSPLVTRMNSVIGLNSNSTRIVDEEKPSFLSFAKTLNYNASRLKHRTKKILESIYSLEPLETLETLISCQRHHNSLSNKYSTLKVIHVLDGAKSDNVISLVFQSLMSRLNITSLEQFKRSSLIAELNEKDITGFMVDYMESLSSDSIEDIWPPLTTFFKEVIANYSNYKSVLSDILKFSTVVGIKLSQVSFGEQKKVRKEMIEIFVKLLNLVTTVKLGTGHEEQSITSILNPINMLPGSDSTHEQSSSTTATLTGQTPELHEQPENPATPTTKLSFFPSGRESSPVKESPTEKDSAKEELCETLVFVAPKIPTIVQENDKVVQCLTTIINNTLISLTKTKNFSQTPNYVIDLIEALSGMNQCSNLKLWKGLCSDILMDSKFFDSAINPRWNKIMYSWIKQDKEKVDELISRLVPYNGSSTLFNWNDSEMSTKTLNLKRTAYILLISPTDFLMNNINDLQTRVSDMLKNSSSQSLKPGIFLLLRVIVFKYTDPHLSTFWPTIYTELQYVFHQLLVLLEEPTDNEKVPEAQTKFDNEMVLQASKLLDVLLVLKPEGFQLAEWLFVSDTIQAVYRDSSVPVLSLIDRISNVRQMRTLEPSDKIPIPSGRVRSPLLIGLNKVESIFELREFFDKLSIYNYESEYDLSDANMSAVEQDMFEDLFG